MPVSIAFIKELEDIDPKLRRVLLSMLEELERQREESVSKKEFNELKEIVRDLVKTTKELAEAQKRTEARVEELAEAQKRTEERLTRLEATVEKLAEAQKRTEEEIAKLVRRMDIFENRLEGISNTVGYGLEDKAYKALPRLLKERFGLEVKGHLIRRYFTVGRKEIQVNIFGHALKDGRTVLILGECKVRPSKREVSRFERYARRIASEVGTEDLFLLFVAYDFSPSIEQELKERGIAYFWSYELE